MEFMEKHVGTVLSGLLISFCVGTAAMLYNADKNNQVFKAQLTFIASRVTSIESDIKNIEISIIKNTADRWTKSDHNKYSIEIDNKINRLWDRINKLESKVDTIKGINGDK